ncbi:MAG: hypothetical protein VX346_21905 [Planctomycetota bacterium]|nr:hypothetical protein [Planctomycetota bacterium]
MSAIGEHGGCLTVRTPWLFRLITLFVYVRKLVIDGKTQSVFIKTRYLWFFKSERVIAFDRIKRLDYLSAVTDRTTTDQYGQTHTRQSASAYKISLVLEQEDSWQSEQITVTSISQSGPARVFLDRLQEITGKSLVNSFERRERDPARGNLSIHSDELYEILELCCAYVAAIDNRFTDIEKHWVDQQFGPGAADRMLSDNRISDSDGCFREITSRLRDLSSADQYFMKTQAHSLFQALIKSDGRQESEKKRVHQLMAYLRESPSTE